MKRGGGGWSYRGVVYGRVVGGGGLKLSAHYDYYKNGVFLTVTMLKNFEIAFSFSLYVLVCYCLCKSIFKGKTTK